MVLKWEYMFREHKLMKLLGDKVSPEQELNRLGEDGWELVGMSVVAGVAYTVFKRPKK